MSMPSFFADSPAELEEAGIVVIPVPYDQTSTWGKGADKGPQAILEASEHLEGYDIHTQTEVWRMGIATDAPVIEQGSPEAMVGAVKQRVAERLQQDKFPVVIGGEHSVSIGAVQAMVDVYPDLTVLQLDAHADLRDCYQGSSYNHACVMARVRECCPFVQVGIRSADKDELDWAHPSRLFYAEHIHRSPDWIDQVMGQLDGPVYVTIDLDVFDPSIMPSTGTPEPGGLLWYPVLSLLRKVCQQCHLVGFDVVELCPNPANRAPDFLAAKLIYTLLSSRFEKTLKKIMDSGR